MKSKNKIFRENELEALRTLKDFLSSKFELLDFRIFGSKVRNEDSLDSDIDVMIVLGKTNPEIESQIDDMIFEINLKNDCFISTVIFSREELEKGPLNESPIYKVIKKEGVSL
jgi:predicted nucleotidyltransferase